MVKGDKKYVLKFQVKDENGDAIDFTDTDGDQPTIKAAANIKTTTATSDDCQIQILGMNPTGTAVATQTIAKSGASCTLKSGVIATEITDDSFTDADGTWQFQLGFKKNTGGTVTQHLSDPILVEVAEAL